MVDKIQDFFRRKMKDKYILNQKRKIQKKYWKNTIKILNINKIDYKKIVEKGKFLNK